MKAAVIIILSLGLIGVGVYFAIQGMNGEGDGTNTFSASEVVSGSAALQIKNQADETLAIAKAKEIWRVQFSLGEDLSDGPCLSNNLIEDWVADIAHNPRKAVDDLPENQCSAYRDGTARHFVELDPEGNVIRAL
ncbi:MAG: hypothetical protein WC505_00210 [Patescibacteria group bacterium]